jgi:hypothetical protein
MFPEILTVHDFQYTRLLQIIIKVGYNPLSEMQKHYANQGGFVYR